jgi:prepilin-type N-terminal cleavage/methylation domain-containing protein
MKRRSGFTLVELMVTVTIVAILATVAVAVYSRYAHQARVADGASLVSDIRMKQETFFSTYSRYISSTTSTTAFDGDVLTCPGITCQGMYRFAPDCTAGGNPWCDLGFRPSGFTMEGVADKLLYFQVQTIAWAPSMSGLEPSFIANPATRWWSVQARGVPEGMPITCTQLRLTNENRELITLKSQTPCQ